MSAADALLAERDKFRRYKTDTAEVSETARTAQGTSSAQLRGTARFLQDLAAAVYLLFDEVARHRRHIDQTPAPAPLAPPSTELGLLRNELQTLRAEVMPRLDEQGLQLVALQYRLEHAALLVPSWMFWGMAGCTAVSLLCVVGVTLGAALLWWSR